MTSAGGGVRTGRRPAISLSAMSVAVMAGLLAAGPSLWTTIAVADFLSNLPSIEQLVRTAGYVLDRLFRYLTSFRFVSAARIVLVVAIVAAAIVLPLASVALYLLRQGRPRFWIAGAAVVLVAAVPLAAVRALYDPGMSVPTLRTSLYFLPAGVVAGLTYRAMLPNVQPSAAGQRTGTHAEAGNGEADGTPRRFRGFERRPVISAPGYLAGMSVGTLTSFLNIHLVLLIDALRRAAQLGQLENFVSFFIGKAGSVNTAYYFISFVPLMTLTAIVLAAPAFLSAMALLEGRGIDSPIGFASAGAITVAATWLFITWILLPFDLYNLTWALLAALLFLPGGVVAGLIYRAILISEPIRERQRHAPQS